MTRHLLAGLALVLPLAAAGCGAAEPAGGDRTLTVLAAASLTETFAELAEDFEAAHPGVQVRLAFDSSATLAGQVVEGAPADVLATADARTMRTAVAAGAVEEPVVFAANRLVLVVPAGDPAGISGPADLDRPGVDYVACVESTPCGALAAELLAVNGVRARPRSLEVDVKAVLNRVSADEADAGLVYVTDAVAAGDAVRTRPVPGSEDRPTRYLAAPVAGAAQPALARAWVEALREPAARRVLDEAGFLPLPSR